MAERGKKYKKQRFGSKDKAYLPEEAVELAKKAATAKFDETLELHMKMGVDPRNAQQQVRGVALLRMVWVKKCVSLYLLRERRRRLPLLPERMLSAMMM
jgi:ribosomal protein L1